MTRDQLRAWAAKLCEVDPDLQYLIREFEGARQYDEEYKMAWFPSLTDTRLREIYDAAKKLEELITKLRKDLDSDLYGKRT